MSRALGLPALLVALCIVGYLAAESMRSSGPASPSVRQAITQAGAGVAATNVRSADTAMQAFYAQNGTYAGATLPPGTGVVLARADATSYCLEAGAEHEDGPGGPL